MEEYKYLLLKTKSVMDFDGFYTDYSLYEVLDLDENTVGYVCVLGDTDLYDPNEGTADFDYETDDLEDAENWYMSYSGYDEDREEFDESLLIEDNINKSVADEYGVFSTLDDEFDMVGNTPDDEIDEIVRHLEKIQKFFRKNPSEIVSYGCADGWLDPLHNREFFETPFKPFSKRNPYSTYIGEYENHDIIVDHMDSRFDFTIYALSEDTIYQIMEKIGGE